MLNFNTEFVDVAPNFEIVIIRFSTRSPKLKALTALKAAGSGRSRLQPAIKGGRNAGADIFARGVMAAAQRLHLCF